LLRITGFPEPNQPDLPDGQSILIFGIDVKPPKSKIFLFYRIKIPATSYPIPSREEGRIMIATIVGRVAVDAKAATDERG